MAATRQHWFNLFTVSTWKDFANSGYRETGFRAGRWATAQKMKPQDYVLCYLTGLSRFIALLEVVGIPYHQALNEAVGSASLERWPFQRRRAMAVRFPFPCKVAVKPLVVLTLETAVPIKSLQNHLSIFAGNKPTAWSGFVRGSPMRWKAEDGDIIVEALLEAAAHPLVHSFDPSKLRYKPKLY